MKTDKIEKFIVDGKVAVIYSINYANPWVSYYDDNNLILRLLFDKFIACHLFLAQKTDDVQEKVELYKSIGDYIEDKYGNHDDFDYYTPIYKLKDNKVYCNLAVRFLKIGTKFRIVDYDGLEIIEQVDVLDYDYSDENLIEL